jgi:hypothetical protein
MVAPYRSGLRPPPRERAYVMPLAVGAAGLLLLMGLMLQGMALRERLQVDGLERQRREDDILTSAAHQLLGALNGPHRCLVTLPLDRWEVEGLACASPEALATLRRAQVWAVPVRLLSWQPGTDGLAAELEVALEASATQAPRRRRFGARLEGTPPLVVDLRLRAFGGGQP